MMNVCIVKQNDTAVRHLREPSVEVVFDCLIGMKAIDMEDIDGPVIKRLSASSK